MNNLLHPHNVDMMQVADGIVDKKVQELEKEKTKHRIIRDGDYLLLCDKNGEPIPRQTYLKIESRVDEKMEVTMKCWVEPDEIQDAILNERTYVIQEDSEREIG